MRTSQLRPLYTAFRSSFLASWRRPILCRLSAQLSVRLAFVVVVSGLGFACATPKPQTQADQQPAQQEASAVKQPEAVATDTEAPTEAPTKASTEANAAPQASAAAPQTLAFPDEPFRSDRPVAGDPRPFQLPEIAKFRLKRLGIDVFLLERHTLPTVSMSLVFEGGSLNDPVRKPGLASVCMSLMEEGTARLDKLAFEEALADIASSVSAFAGTTQQGVTASTLSKNLDATLDLFADMLRTPGFRQVDLDRLVARELESLKQAKATVSSLAGRLRGFVTHGPKHAFGRLETDASLKAITTKDCRAYHAAWIKPRGAKLFVVGDITEEIIREKIASRLLLGSSAGTAQATPPKTTKTTKTAKTTKTQKWAGRPRKSRALGRARPPRGRIFFAPVPGSAQSAVYLYHAGPKRNARDHLATELMERVLGKGFSSRINMNLREDKGWAYGARGSFSYFKGGSTFAAGASVQTDHTKDALLELQEEIVSMKRQSAPITDAELEREKEGSILALPGKFSTASQALSMYRELVYYKMPLGYWNRYVQRVSGLKKKQLVKAARKHLKPKALVALVVGDPNSVLPGLYGLTATKSLGKGPLVILDGDGNVQQVLNPKAAAKALKKSVPNKASKEPEQSSPTDATRDVK